MSEALKDQLELLEALQKEEALVSDAADRWRLKKRIEETEKKIATLKDKDSKELEIRTPGPIGVSVCTATKRCNPRLDQMIRLLMKQTVSQTFEYIIVDGYYHTRRDYMAGLISELNPQFTVRHIPPKPSRWEHIRPALCSALNTGLVWARGGLIVELDDCCIEMPPEWLERHVGWHLRGYAVSGSWKINGWEDERCKKFDKATHIGPELFYGGHRSFPLQKAIEVNGYEEQLDGEQGQSDIVLALMLSQTGVEFMYDPDLCVAFDARSHTLTQLSPDHRKAKWGKEPWAVTPKTRKMTDGTPHYSNEWLANEIMEEGRAKPRGNKFELTELRNLPPQNYYRVADIQHKLEKYVDPDPRDWRDDQEIAHMRGGEFVHSRGEDILLGRAEVKCAAISPDAKEIVVTSEGFVEKFTRTTQKRLSTPLDIEASSVCLSPLTRNLLVAFRTTRVYSPDLTKLDELDESEDVVQSLCVSSSEKYIAAGGWDSAVYAWTFETRELKCSLKLPSSVTALAFLDDDRRLVAGTSSGDTWLCNLETSKVASINHFDCPVSAVFPFIFSGRTSILVGSQDGHLAMCDASSGESHLLLRPGNQSVQSIHVKSTHIASEAATYAVTGASNGEITVLDIDKRSILQTILVRDAILAVHISLELCTIFAVTSAGELLCWSINPRVAQGEF